MENNNTYDLNLTNEFLDVEFPDLEISAGMGIVDCCNRGETI